MIIIVKKTGKSFSYIFLYKKQDDNQNRLITKQLTHNRSEFTSDTISRPCRPSRFNHQCRSGLTYTFTRVAAEPPRVHSAALQQQLLCNTLQHTYTHGPVSALDTFKFSATRFDSLVVDSKKMCVRLE